MSIPTLSLDPTVSVIVTFVSCSRSVLLISAFPTGCAGESTFCSSVGVNAQVAKLAAAQSCFSVAAWAYAGPPDVASHLVREGCGDIHIGTEVADDHPVIQDRVVGLLAQPRIGRALGRRTRS